MKAQLHQFNAWLTLLSGTQVAVGKLAFEQTVREITLAQFKYDERYLTSPAAFSLDPVNLPLSSRIFEFDRLPGVFDDALPDRWGRNVAKAIDGIQSQDVAGLCDWLGGHQVGALDLTRNLPRTRGLVHPFEQLQDLHNESLKFETSWDPKISQQMRLAISTGASVGGARRKILITKRNKAYIAKFQHRNDGFNNVRVEHASLNLAAKMGIETPTSIVVPVGNREALLVRRFDVVNEIPCLHKISFKTLLGDNELAQYSDLAKVMCEHISTRRLGLCLKQLFAQMCFNICIKNTDDHLRNFTLLHDDKGWITSPAYDLVPSETIGEYHQLGFNSSQTPPRGTRLIEYAIKYFKLNANEATRIIHQCKGVVANWRSEFAQQGVSENDISYLSHAIRDRL